MKISTNSAQLRDDGSSFGDYNERFAYLNSCNYDAVDFNLSSEGRIYNLKSHILSENWKEKISAIKDAAEKNNIQIFQTHLPFHGYSEDVEQIDTDEMKYFADRMKICIEASKLLGAEYAVVHPRRKNTIEESIEVTKKYLSEYLEFARNIGMKIAVENVFYMTAEELLAIINALGEDVYACWDTGHSNLACVNQYESITLLGDRIKVIHLHDNNSTAAVLHDNAVIKDEHHPLYLGNIVWEDVWRALKDIKYSGTFNLEVSLPKYMRSYWNKHLAQLSKRIIEDYSL